MNFKIISILAIFFLFLGCSSKENPYIKSTDILHEQAMTQTKKTAIKVGDVTKVYISATYLNQINHKLAGFNEKVDRFIVNVYVPSEVSQELYEKIEFVVNDVVQEPLKELQKDDALLKIIPTVTPWSKYYLLESPRVYKSKTITLSFKTLDGDIATLNFIKDEL